MKMNMQSIMQQAHKVQQEIERVKKEISEKTVTAESGGGMVSVVMTGNNELKQLKISKEIVNPDDIEMLEDLIVAAVNTATQNASAMAADEMQKVTGMLPNIPGFNL